ncbi:MAG: hypothetical protein WC008_04140 [Bacilli bacterium]
MNIFDYAKKELSQDAFLCWLLTNYNNNDNEKLKVASYKVLCRLTNRDFEIGSVYDMEIYQQWLRIDVVIGFWVNGKRYYLAIEDKVESCEHNQLKGYKTSLERYQSKIKNRPYSVSEIFYSYYKTSIIGEEEEKRIKEAQWETSILDIDSIYELFTQLKGTGSEVFDSYCEHIEKLHRSYHNLSLPEGNSHDMIAWKAYFESLFKQKLIDSHYLKNYVSSTRYGYSYIILTDDTNFSDSDIAYLEIRSRDCVNKEFQARLLIYGRKNMSKGTPNYDAFKTAIRSKNNFFHERNTSMQLAITKKIPFLTEKDFIGLINKSINEYISICNKYKELVKK